MTRVVHVLAILALALGLSACGSSATLAADPVAEAATKTRDAGSSRVALRISVAAPGRRLSFGAEGAFDYRRNRGTLSYDLSALGGGRGEIRFDERVLYVHMPELRSMLPEGKSWLKVDVDARARGAGAGPLDLFGGGQDPTQLLEYLRSLDAKPTVVGRDRVRGVQTTHYRARLNVAKALEQGLDDVPEERRRAAEEQLRAMMETAGLNTLPIDVWVDSDGRLRRLTMRSAVRVPAQQGAANTSFALTIDFFDFGVAVAVEEPPAAATFDATKLVPAPAGG